MSDAHSLTRPMSACSASQGPHQSAQKVSTATSPRIDARSNESLSSASRSGSGAAGRASGSRQVHAAVIGSGHPSPASSSATCRTPVTSVSRPVSCACSISQKVAGARPPAVHVSSCPHPAPALALIRARPSGTHSTGFRFTSDRQLSQLILLSPSSQVGRQPETHQCINRSNRLGEPCGRSTYRAIRRPRSRPVGPSAGSGSAT